jgi:hypothetical protein
VPTISVVVPLRDERERLPAVLAMIEAQTRQPDEVVVADGRSTDGSREWLEDAARTRPWLRVVDNPDRVVPAALNVLLSHARGDVVVRMDTHADYDPDYVASLVTVLNEHPEAVGAGALMRTSGRGAWGTAIAAVLAHPVGLGGARHRVGGVGGPVEHVFTGAYRSAALVAVGGVDAGQLANEDAELDVRLRAAGGVLWLDPQERSTWWVRRTPRALAEQMWRYGHFRARTVVLHPSSLRARQIAPPAVVLGLCGLLVARPRVGAAAALGYAVAAAGAGVLAAQGSEAEAWRAAAVVPVVHLSWGGGYLTGAVRHLLTGRAPRLPGAEALTQSRAAVRAELGPLRRTRRKPKP